MSTSLVTTGRRSPLARYAWVPTLALGLGLFFAVERTMIATENPNFLPSVILLGAAAVPVAFVVLIYGLDLPYDVPAGTIWATGLVGGVIGTVVAGVLEYQTLRGLGPFAMFGIGLIEEAAKLVVPFFILLLMPYRRRSDGLLIGVASGAGFAALETMGYALVHLFATHGNLGAVENLLMLRGLLSPAGHMAWTGIAAAALWWAAAEGWSAAATSRFVVTYFVVSMLHGFWDYYGNLPALAVISSVSLLLLGLWTLNLSVTEPVATTPHPTRQPAYS
jgi:RsiW-degrading membrane proteinase PrsW (M82 family)